ncbi:MAG: lipid A biosynthesis acyltransferase [Bacteroidales bacterium]|nr:lipid A biosynthesis acyltransferase [Bacteroidales bacterium]
MKRLPSTLIFGILWLFTLLPLAVLYRFADLLFAVNYYIVGYRKKVVLKNLRNAFPAKDEAWRVQVARKFFRHLSDFLIESVKTIHITKQQINKRYTFVNAGLFQKYYREKRDVTLISGHYANWEWMINFPAFVQHRFLVIYQPLQNKFVNNLINGLRGKFGVEPVPMNDIYKRVLDYKKRGMPTITWFLGDQRPPSATPFWTLFLNQETGFYMGPEKIAKKLDHAVVFMDIQKIKRGRYQVVFLELIRSAGQTADFEVSSAHVKKLEETIMKEPAFWLWSHKRWKHKRPVNRELTPLTKP